MRDPHVVALHYRLETGPQLVFANPEPLECGTDAFTLWLADGHLRVELKDHFPTGEAAQREVEPFLHSWEIATALQEDPGAIKFKFERADVIDRDPPPPRGSVRIQPLSGEIVSIGESVAPRLSRVRYPDPPDKFIASPEVIAMWERFEGYRAKREPLPSMAYYCLTVFHGTEARGTVSENVVSRLSYLSTMVGEPHTLRKRQDGQELRPHTPAEVAWMEAVVKRLIQRVGEWAADPNASWPLITMKDFPGLGSDL
jgi:hypothetical protein